MSSTNTRLHISIKRQEKEWQWQSLDEKPSFFPWILFLLYSALVFTPICEQFTVMKIKPYFPKGGGGRLIQITTEKTNKYIKLFTKNIYIAITREQAKLKCLLRISFLQTVIKIESSFEARKARTIDRTLDSIVPEMGTHTILCKTRINTEYQ
jgi:hypothetical protein